MSTSASSQVAAEPPASYSPRALATTRGTTAARPAAKESAEISARGCPGSGGAAATGDSWRMGSASGVVPGAAAIVGSSRGGGGAGAAATTDGASREAAARGRSLARRGPRALDLGVPPEPANPARAFATACTGVGARVPSTPVPQGRNTARAIAGMVGPPDRTMTWDSATQTRAPVATADRRRRSSSREPSNPSARIAPRATQSITAQ